MRASALALLLSAALCGTASAATYSFTYKGAPLAAVAQNGVSGVTHLSFAFSTTKPLPKNLCVAILTNGVMAHGWKLVSFADGKQTDTSLTKAGFTLDRASSGEICANAIGKITSWTVSLYDVDSAGAFWQFYTSTQNGGDLVRYSSSESIGKSDFSGKIGKWLIKGTP